jgi:glutaredoxin 3
MELSYFRKSTRSFEDTRTFLKSAIDAQSVSTLAEITLEAGKIAMVLACKPEWAKKIIDTDHRIAGFLPCSFYVIEKNGSISVGAGEPSILKTLAQNGPLTELAIEIEAVSREIIHDAAGVGELKPSEVVVYATMTCPYCTKVKQWLESNNVKHTVKYVDLDREAGQAMVQKTGQMGVPVTEILFGEETEPKLILGFDETQLAETFLSR